MASGKDQSSLKETESSGLQVIKELNKLPGSLG